MLILENAPSMELKIAHCNMYYVCAHFYTCVFVCPQSHYKFWDLKEPAFVFVTGRGDEKLQIEIVLAYLDII